MKAFPHTYKHPTSGLFVEEQGMELRDWFAGQAIIACIAKHKTPAVQARYAYLIADELIKAREKTDD